MRHFHRQIRRAGVKSMFAKGKMRERSDRGNCEELTKTEKTLHTKLKCWNRVFRGFYSLHLCITKRQKKL